MIIPPKFYKQRLSELLSQDNKQTCGLAAKEKMALLFEQRAPDCFPSLLFWFQRKKNSLFAFACLSPLRHHFGLCTWLPSSFQVLLFTIDINAGLLRALIWQLLCICFGRIYPNSARQSRRSRLFVDKALRMAVISRK